MKSSQTVTTRQKQAIETKRKIFNTALTLFTRRTYEDVTIQDICKEANVSIGAFYHHFQNKADLINAGYKLFDQQTEENFEDMQCDNPLEIIQFLISEQTHSMESLGVLACTQFYKMQLSCDEKYILDPERFFYRTIYESVKKSIDLQLLKDEPDVITNDILSATRGLIYDWCLHDGTFSLSDRSQKMLDMIWNYYKYN